MADLRRPTVFASFVLPLLISLALVGAAAAQRLPAGPQVLTFYSDVDDTEQPYGLYVPADFDETKAYPLVISLHGAGSNHRLNLKRVFGKSNVGDENDVEASRYFQPWDDEPYIVASPLARGTMGYEGIAEKDVLDVLADVKRRFRIDENRVYLTGLSMGGGGTLYLGLSRPDLWAAIAPVCPAPPQGTEALVGNALNLPVYIHQGGADPVVRPEGVRAWVERFEDLGTNVQYTEYPGVGHNSWENAYADGQIFDWFGQHVRNPYPDRVRFASTRYKHDAAYWVTLDALTTGTLASIDAAFEGPNTIVVTTAELDGFTLDLTDHPRFDASRPVRVTIDGSPLTAEGPMLSFQKTAGSWAPGRFARASDQKGPGSEGPAAEVVASRHVYVYGTGGDPSEEELAARRQQAETAANWSVYRGAFMGRVLVYPRVMADRELRQSDVDSANLVLFGTEETNAVIARYANRLPVHLTDTSQDYGLAYTFPVGDHYVLISSGLPWWQAPSGGGNFFAFQIPALTLPGDADYLLFRGDTSNPIARGRFDRSWSIPDADARKMTETGVIRLNNL